ncbi:methyltransferase regulatory domain-containing protein [Testudinibacter sp. TR-2022]|uniref:methyltransferase regulatory domain-containing protein n=1 Tax=Testudinibacter sp. TR-2022 TaxID=2585029 RepID=UPI0011194E89|nr:class I SAM-dependent methyltransferase [Testudinibacter sp. TR-2022]TNH06742.1 methyltransferase domain-containing protein [Pasteurellaceae bacterium Phil11]TNH20575.1 methyltransferase domain-containing protein [Testudinibacter sp. TR-2022]TNH26064.1 methyltransferase domain-containing protein [Testudinibacter sp. TR-2022]
MDTTLLQKNAKSYDDFPYVSHPFAKSFPPLHQAIGQLFGLNPPDLTQARILELGCASGGNIIPITFFYPEVEVVGVDLSQVQIAQGLQIVEQMGLQQRVKLHHLSITDIPESFGLFDYIICHGVYSWVPDFVQSGIFDVIRKHLKSDGIAYISYNVYPGWKSLEIARDAMLFHTRDIQDPVAKVEHAKAMIGYMHEKAPENTMFKRIMQNVDGLVQRSAPYYLAHEFLEIHNSPLYFSEMVNKAESHQLAYLNDAEISSSFPENWGVEIHRDLLNASHNQQVVLEQYLDYLNNRQFRQSLFIPQTTSNRLQRHISAETVQSCHFSISIKQEQSPRPDAPDYTYFIFNHNANQFYRTQNIAELEALTVLCRFDNCFFNIKEYQQALNETAQQHYSLEFITHLLLRLIISGLLHISGTPPITNRPINYISERPMISDFNRRYFSLRNYIVNARNEMLSLDLIQSILLPHLDGQQTLENLHAILLRHHQEGKIKFNRNTADNGTADEITDLADVQKLTTEFLNNALQNWCNSGVLVG